MGAEFGQVRKSAPLPRTLKPKLDLFAPASIDRQPLVRAGEIARRSAKEDYCWSVKGGVGHHYLRICHPVTDGDPDE
jgi:hypothetical protein